jgi:hypothetical protein
MFGFPITPLFNLNSGLKRRAKIKKIKKNE